MDDNGFVWFGPFPGVRLGIVEGRGAGGMEERVLRGIRVGSVAEAEEGQAAVMRAQ